MLVYLKNFFSDLKTDLFHSSLLFSGNVLGQVISFLAYPVIARLYTPEQFGEFSLFLSITGILVIIATGRLEYAIVIAKDDEESNTLQRIGLRWCFIFSTLCLVIAIAMSFNNQINLKVPGLYIIPFSVFLSGVIQIFTLYRNRLKHYKKLAHVSVVQNITSTGMKISLGFVSVLQYPLIFGSLLGQIVAAFTISWNLVSKELFKIPLHYKEVIRKYSAFPKYRMWQALINNVSSNFPILLLTFYFSAKISGYYGLVIGIAYKFISLISSAVYPVLYRRFSELKNQGRPLLGIYVKNSLILFVLALVPAILVYIFSSPLIRLFLGENWMEVSLYLKVMLPWLVMTFVASPFAFMADVFSLQKEVLIIDILHLFFRLLALFIGIWLNEVFLSIILYSATSFAFLIFIIVWYYYILKKPLNEGFKQQNAKI